MIDPIALQLGPISIHWYGIAYMLSLIFAIIIIWQLNKKRPVFKDKDQIFDFIFNVFLFGVILGGRLGYVLFYNFSNYLNNPLKIFAIWEGGMSFHGGLIASIIVTIWFCKKHKIKLMELGDLVIIPVPLAISIGRIGNFINGELVGRVIKNEKWMWLGERYPSQLFQSISSFIVFLFLLFVYSKKPKTGMVFFGYLALHGFARFITEFWRAPDEQIGFLMQYFTLGQFFSLVMIIVGIVGVIRVNLNKEY